MLKIITVSSIHSIGGGGGSSSGGGDGGGGSSNSSSGSGGVEGYHNQIAVLPTTIIKHMTYDIKVRQFHVSKFLDIPLKLNFH